MPEIIARWPGRRMPLESLTPRAIEISLARGRRFHADRLLLEGDEFLEVA